MDRMNSDTYNFDETESEVVSDYSDGVSEDSVDSDDIHIWATEKLKISKKTADRNVDDKSIIEKVAFLVVENLSVLNKNMLIVSGH